MKHLSKEEILEEIKLIEKDEKRCFELAEQIPFATILNQDPSDLNFLITERVKESDVFVTCHDSTETNILSATLAKEAGCKVEYIPLVRRDIYWATEVRKRMISGDNWKELVPKSVADFIILEDGVQRIKDLLQPDISIHD